MGQIQYVMDKVGMLCEQFSMVWMNQVCYGTNPVCNGKIWYVMGQVQYVMENVSRPLKSTQRHGHFLKLTCDMELSDMRKNKRDLNSTGNKRTS